MNKTLSEQICELCGIEPIKKCPLDCKKKFEQIENSSSFVELTCEYGKNPYRCNFYKLAYPDFEKSENFVKLQSLLIEGGMGFDIQLIDYPTKLQIRFCWDDANFIFKIFGNNLKEVFLRFVLQICELDEEGDIKQSIRDYDGWIWG